MPKSFLVGRKYSRSRRHSELGEREVKAAAAKERGKFSICPFLIHTEVEQKGECVSTNRKYIEQGIAEYCVCKIDLLRLCLDLCIS